MSETRSIDLPIPFGELGPGYISKRVDLHLSERQAEAMRRILNGLKAGGRRLNNDYPIESNADVIRWFLDSLADQT